MAAPGKPTRIGLAGLAVMGQNLALNIAEKGFPISVYNRTTSKVDETVERAKAEGNLPLYGFHDPESFVQSIQNSKSKNRIPSKFSSIGILGTCLFYNTTKMVLN